MKNKKEHFRVLLVGCGDIGTRHLQAAAGVPEIDVIEVVDPNPEALQLGQERLNQIQNRESPISFRWLTALDQATKSGDLCVVATRASGRARLVMEIVQKLNYQNFLIEKIVDQSILNYEKLLGFCDSNHVNVWVNHKGRTYPFHQHFKRQIDPKLPISLTFVSGNHGLANSGTHVADLFFFYDGSKRLTKVHSCIDPILHRTKRNQFDLSGTIIAVSEKGSLLNLCYQKDHLNPPFYVITTEDHRFVFDHPHDDESKQFGFESDAASGWEWKPVSLAGNYLISHMSTTFISDILQKGACELPTVEEAYPAHKLILETLLPHFKELLDKSIDYCPVT